MSTRHYQIRKYYKIISLLAIILLLIFISLTSFAGVYLGLAAAVKTKVQELKDKYEQKLEENNNLPVITALTANPTIVYTGAVTTITCSASDPDNNPLAYSWSAASGTISGTSSQITWTAPMVSSSYIVYCTVSDGKGGTTQQSVNIAVTANLATAWTKLFGTTEYDKGAGVATDLLRNIYVTGGILGSPVGANDIFLAKYDNNGTNLWTKQFGTTEYDKGTGVATDSAGNIYVTGFTFGSLGVNLSQYGDDIFLAKYDTNGAELWTKQFGTSNDDYSLGVATDSAGNIYITGGTTGSLDGNINQGANDIFVTKYDANGTKLWTKQFGTSSVDEGTGVATDLAGNIYVTGYTYGSLNGNVNQGDNDMFLAKYDTNGTELWTKQFGTTEYDKGTGVATDSAGNIYVTGYTYGSLNGNVNQGDNDMFLAKYDTNGTELWTKQFGTSSVDASTGVVTDSAGNIYVTGCAYGNLDGNINQGNYDLFLLKYDASGLKLWTKLFGTSSVDKGAGVATDSAGNIYVTGYTEGNFDGNTNQGYEDIFLLKAEP